MWKQIVVVVVMLVFSVSCVHKNNFETQDEDRSNEKKQKKSPSRRFLDGCRGNPRRRFERFWEQEKVHFRSDKQDGVPQTLIRNERNKLSKLRRYVQFQEKKPTNTKIPLYIPLYGERKNRKLLKRSLESVPYTKITTTPPPTTTPEIYYCDTQPYRPTPTYSTPSTTPPSYTTIPSTLTTTPPTTYTTTPPTTPPPTTQQTTYPPTADQHLSAIKNKRSVRKRQSEKQPSKHKDIDLTDGVEVVLKCTVGTQVVWKRKMIYSKIPVYYVRQNPRGKQLSLFAPLNAQKDPTILCGVENYRPITSGATNLLMTQFEKKKTKEKKGLNVYNFVHVVKRTKRSDEDWSSYPYISHRPPLLQQYTRPPSNNAFREHSPILRAVQHNMTVGPGETAKLKCKVENLGTKTLTWRKEDELHPISIGQVFFAPDSRMTLDHNGRNSEWTLTINDVKPSDEGTYLCQISSKHEDISDHITLNVKS